MIIEFQKYNENDRELRRTFIFGKNEYVKFNPETLDLMYEIDLFKMEFNKSPILSDITNIKYTDRNDIISYSPVNRKENTQEMRVGRFFNKIFPNLSSPQIESMVNEYKALYDYRIKNNFNNFKLVKGKEIREWYKISKARYKRPRSCMTIRDEGKLGFLSNIWSRIKFRLYVGNPDKINLLILPDVNGKLEGRALIWYLDEPEGRVFMDKVYGDQKVKEKNKNRS